MTASSGLLDFFTLEAREYLDRMDALLAAADARGPDADAFARDARALRGSATMARLTPLADVASGVERVAVALRDGSLPWQSPLSDAVSAAVRDLRTLVANVRAWGEPEQELAGARTEELRQAVATGAAGAVPANAARGPIVPISRLFFDDDGPHVVERAADPPTSADVRFRAAAVPVASELRRVIAIARKEDASSPAAHLTAGADVRSALRDLRELAESYDVRPVVAFAAARESAVELLEERALATVDAAASAIIESGSGRPGRVTPVPTSARAAEPTPAAPAAPVEAPEPARADEPVGVPVDAPTVDTAAVAEPAGTAGAAQTPAADAPAEPRDSPWPITAPESMAAVPARRTPSASMMPTPTGPALRALLEDSIQEMSLLAERPFGEPEPAGAERDGAVGEGVSIDQLLYRGRAALDRARELRDVMRSQGGAPDPAVLAELFELLDLAATESPTS
jgi:chemotaxis protein histidine kinase CheA